MCACHSLPNGAGKADSAEGVVKSDIRRPDKALAAAILALSMLAVGCLLSGCDTQTYVVELTPEGDKLRRELSLPLPSQLTGNASYVRYTTRMGDLCSYSERFGGSPGVSDGLAAGSAEREKAADKLTDLLIGWFEMEMGEAHGFEKLRRFLDGQFRRDMRELARFHWMAECVEKYGDNNGTGVGYHMLQYFSERGYFEPEEIPSIVRQLYVDDPNAILAFVRRFLAEKMGVPPHEPTPPSLSFLSDPESVGVFFEDYLRTTDAYKKMLEEWERKRKTNPDAPRPEPAEVLSPMLTKVIPLNLYVLLDRLYVRLNCPVEPFETNGTWHGGSGQVRWSEGISEVDKAGTFCYATWSRPNVRFQRRHFGKVMLEGSELAEYVIWRRGLTEEEADEWDEFVAGLEPDDELREALKQFQFSDSPGLEKVPRRLLARELV